MKTINSVSIDITYNCNFRCKHCFNSSGCIADSLELSDEEFFLIAEDIAEQHPDSLCFCGGEPLLRKDLIFSIAKHFLEHSKETILSMVSNGSMLDDSVAQRLHEVGISRVQISLDGSTAETHDWLRQRGSFVSAINALTILKNHQIESAVAFSPNSHNKNELSDVIDMVAELGCKELRIQPLMLLGRALEHPDDFSLDYHDYMYIKRIINQKNEKYIDQEFTCVWGDPLSHLKMALDNAFYHLIVSSSGNILATPYLPISFGNLRNAKIKQYIDAGLFSVLKDNALAKYLLSKIDSTDNMALLDYGFSGQNRENQIELDLISATYESETEEHLKNLCRYTRGNDNE